MLRKFFKLPLHSVHILLDLKGKTLSHAFVRLATPDARLALRSTQNAILGEGRRARAVTVTLASVDELLTAVIAQLGTCAFGDLFDCRHIPIGKERSKMAFLLLTDLLRRK